MASTNLAAVVGVPGVGKTSLSIKAAEDLGYQHLNYGELMLQIAQKLNLASELSEIFGLDLSVQYHIWREVARSAILKTKTKNTILDLHGLDISSQGYIISLPWEIIPPDIICIIEASPEEIERRREKDSKRKRVIEKINTIQRNMQLLRQAMGVCSVLIGCKLTIIDNNDYNKGVDELEAILTSI